MTDVLFIPQISFNDNIKPEYLESYNREPSPAEVEDLIQLLQGGFYQKVVDRFHVRKIICNNDQAMRLVAALVATDRLEVFKFIYHKLSYDNKACGIYSLRTLSGSKGLNQYIMEKSESFGDDYEDEFRGFKERFAQ